MRQYDRSVSNTLFCRLLVVGTLSIPAVLEFSLQHTLGIWNEITNKVLRYRASVQE